MSIINRAQLLTPNLSATGRLGPLNGRLNAADAPAASDGPNFALLLQEALQGVERAQKYSDQMSIDALRGSVDIHQATVAMEKATLTLRTFVLVRDKMLEAYQEITRMQV